MDYVLLGKRIREARKEKDLKREKLAELSEITDSYIGIIERADKKPSINTLVKIASALDVSTDHLLRDSLKLSPSARVGEFTELIKGLDNKDVDLVVDILRSIVGHLKKQD